MLIAILAVAAWTLPLAQWLYFCAAVFSSLNVLLLSTASIARKHIKA